MSRITPLFKVDSFRNSIVYLLGLSQERVQQLRDEALIEIAATTGRTPQSDDELAKRALAILYEAAARDGADEIERELREAFADEGARLDPLVAAIAPGADSITRLTSIDERDAFVPILTGHRFALDLRVVEAADGTPVATPLVTVRFNFDSTIGSGTDAIVFQVNLAELQPLENALSDVRSRAARLIKSSEAMSILPGWGHDAPAE